MQDQWADFTRTEAVLRQQERPMAEAAEANDTSRREEEEVAKKLGSMNVDIDRREFFPEV